MGRRPGRSALTAETGASAASAAPARAGGGRPPRRKALEPPAVRVRGVASAARDAVDDPPPYGLSADDEQLVKVCRALGDPVRFRLVQMLLAREELGCAELQQLFPLSRPALSYHTRVLSECGLLAVRKVGAFHFLRLRRERLAEHLPGGLLAGPPTAGR